MDTVFQESGPRTSLALPPRTILNGAYEIGRVLGKGGFGITYAALDTHLKVPVAIKEYLPAQVAGRGTDQSTVQPHGGDEKDVFEHGLNAFLSEAQTLAQFNHPNIVQVRAFFRQNGTGYLVMPFYEGRTLDAVMAEHDGPMPCEEAAALVEPVMNGLEAVHSRNILHRDIKPQNVYITDSGETILLDFGAARIAFGQESQSLSAVLTPGYAPFEQYSRRGHQGPWTDVYATAAMLYRMVTGDKPPEATDRLAGEPLAPIHLKNPSVSPSFANAVTSALATMPKDRPQTIAGFRSMLLGVPGDETVIADAETVLVGDETIIAPEATLLQSAGDARTVQQTVAATTALVIRAREACRFKLDGGAVMSLGAGEERVLPVDPGEHTVSAAFGSQKHSTTVSVRRGERRVVPLALPERSRSKKRGPARGPTRPAAGGRKTSPVVWILLGSGGFLLLVLLFSIPWGETFETTPVDVPTDAPFPTLVDLEDIGEPLVTNGSLASGDATLRSGEYADLYTLQAEEANYLFVELTSSDFDPYLILNGPDGTRIIENDDFDNDLSVSYFDVELPTPGDYQLFVTSASSGETGSYTLTVTPDQL